MKTDILEGGEDLPCSQQLLGTLLHELTCKDCDGTGKGKVTVCLAGETDGEPVVLCAFAMLLPLTATQANVDELAKRLDRLAREITDVAEMSTARPN